MDRDPAGWTVLDPVEEAIDHGSPADYARPLLLDWDGSVLFWNARAKGRLRLARVPVQGGMTYRTLDLMQDWAESRLSYWNPRACRISLPAWARIPDLRSPNACLLHRCILPAQRDAGIPLRVRLLQAPLEAGLWESGTKFPDHSPRVMEDLAVLLGDACALEVEADAPPDAPLPGGGGDQRL